MIKIPLLRFIHRSIVLKESGYIFNFWFSRRYFFSIPCLICVGIFILIAIVIALLLREIIRESTKRCPYCRQRIPTDAAWCKFCKRDLTEDFVPFDRSLDYAYNLKSCPECYQNMNYIAEHDRWYCPQCREYK